MSVIIVRHGERQDYVDATWVKRADRPWDPPLTPQGKMQAKAAGKRIRDEITRDHGVPKPTRVYCSPFTRCVETAAEIANELGVVELRVEYGLAEDLCENFFRSWCLPESNGSWGGPNRGTAVDADTKMHPKALEDFGELILNPATLKDLVSPLVDTEYAPFHTLQGKGFKWGNCEEREALVDRLRAVCAHLHQQAKEESIVLVTHGGPLMMLSNALQLNGGKTKAKGRCGYTGLTVCIPTPDGDWAGPIVADHSHIDAKGYCTVG
mmetsp:Transcript_4994/g.8669  ORF Transcript_4994/g.8669 Transcript_4994/m.8669 type:complete len:266 (-) Transcript_4994:909-1706(-)|eukprot:CAMPEP_0198205398 /NCGR_PEP_ID=MMETSP1445-20131203/8934_1 /TAXON_ID=36898 /ORGANISM="Pyramimonas sp., Strain CCMP2087" /LENGTH=265 /DNA_ID=CAMNT_0043877693 /DNA_START=95 /DNA_END=895 /DNA_ORIENTATION=+